MGEQQEAPQASKAEAGAGEPESQPRGGAGREQESTVKIGHHARDFEAPAYMDGKFGTVKLSDYRGKWVLLFFYVGDFTFV